MNKFFESLKGVSPGSWARLALLIAVLVNNTLTVFGVNPPVPGGKAGEIIVTVTTVLSSLLAYWKNNSFTAAAQQADEYMEMLKRKD